MKRKIALFCNVEFGAVIESRDVPTIYEIPLAFHEQGLDEQVLQTSRPRAARRPTSSHWSEMVQRVVAPRERVRIAVVGKYTDSWTATRACRKRSSTAASPTTSASTSTGSRATCSSTRERAARASSAGIDGAARARRLRRARRRRHGRGDPRTRARRGCRSSASASACRRRSSSSRATCCGLDDSHSSEFAPECDNPVISLMESQQHVTDMGGTMRLGAYPCRLARGSRAAEVYGVAGGERAAPAPLRGLEHVPRPVRRARAAAERPVARRLSSSRSSSSPTIRGSSAASSIPELQSRPTRPHPLFAGFIAAAAAAKRRAATAKRRPSLVEAARLT